MLRNITNDLAASYLDFTGKNSAALSVSDYLQFREVAVKEYLMGLHKEPEKSYQNVSHDVYDVQEEPRNYNKEPEKHPQNDSYNTQKTPQQVNRSESVTNTVSNENMSTTKAQEDDLLSLLQSIPG